MGSISRRKVVSALGTAGALFERYGMPRERATVRQILGRPGEVWLPESGTEHISVIYTG